MKSSSKLLEFYFGPIRGSYSTILFSFGLKGLKLFLEFELPSLSELSLKVYFLIICLSPEMPFLSELTTLSSWSSYWMPKNETRLIRFLFNSVQLLTLFKLFEILLRHLAKCYIERTFGFCKLKRLSKSHLIALSPWLFLIEKSSYFDSSIFL